jgi:hypothetical protein
MIAQKKKRKEKQKSAGLVIPDITWVGLGRSMWTCRLMTDIPWM